MLLARLYIFLNVLRYEKKPLLKLRCTHILTFLIHINPLNKLPIRTCNTENLIELTFLFKQMQDYKQFCAFSAVAICGGRCCDKDIEDHLREKAKEDFHKQIHHHSRSLLGLLATTADALRGKFFNVLKSYKIFTQVSSIILIIAISLELQISKVLIFEFQIIRSKR